MDIFAGIKTLIFMISNCVIYPVLILLICLASWILFECGRLVSEWLSRKRAAPGNHPPAVARYLTELDSLLGAQWDEADVQNLIRSRIQDANASLDKFRIATRVGPALGLMGTLVPMGAALASLGQGDISVMSSELVLAYTTTVVGLVIGSIAFCIYSIRFRFIEDDIREMEFQTEKKAQ